MRHLRSLGCSAVAGAVVAASLTAALGAVQGRPGPRAIRCRDKADTARPVALTVEGERATGRYAVPAKKPRALVVFAHGYGHTSASWAEHMRDAAGKHGVAAVAMDYRGIKISPDSDKDGLPESRGWNVMAGAEDSIAAAKAFEKRCKSIKTIVVFGVSMGGNTSGLALALAGQKGIKKSDGGPLFDYWFDVEGAVNLTETYLEARGAAQANATAANAREDIEKETGGPIEQEPDEYQKRTVVARIDDIQAASPKGAVVIHGVDDGLVPYNQAREMASLLASSAIPTTMVTITTRSKESERETTLTGHAASNVDPNYKSPFAGHASEKSKTHIVMVTAFERLWTLLERDNAQMEAYSEVVVVGDYRGPSAR